MTVEEIAAAIGEDVDEVRRWHALGLLGAEDEIAVEGVERARLVQFAGRRGVAPDEVARISAEQGDMLAPFVRWARSGDPGPMFTRAEAAERTGLDAELVDQVWAASGMWDQPQAYEEDLEALRIVATAVKFGLPIDALLQILRVFADSLGKASEAATRLFHLHVHEQLRAQGLRGGELMAATQAVGDPLAELVEPAILYFHHKTWERANREDLILHLQEESTAPGEFVRTLLFVDVSGYTSMTETIGDAAVARMLDRFSGRVRQTTAACNGEVVKQIGDEFMLVFPDAPSAIQFGTTIQTPAADDDLPPLRIGAHSGPVLYREGDYYGNTVNLAARTTSVARGGQFVVTDALRTQLGPELQTRLVALGPHTVKGITEPVELFEVSDSSRA